MKRYAMIIIAVIISHTAFGGHIVDVTFNGDTNDIYSVEIHKGKGTKEFDAFLEIQQSGRIGLCERISVENFKAEENKVSLSIQATSNELNGFRVVNSKNRKLKYPIIKTKEVVLDSLTLHVNSWLTIGWVSTSNEERTPIMIRVRKRISSM